MTRKKPKALYIMGPGSLERIYGPEQQTALAERVTFIDKPHTPESIRKRDDLLAEMEVLISGWGAPVFNESFLERTPNLKAVFYGAGTIRNCVTDAFWERNIRITSAAAGNAVPVSEYALATILLSLKHFWYFSRKTAELGGRPARHDPPGAFQTTVGLISLGVIGRLVCERLQPFDIRILAYDPHLSSGEAESMNVEPVSLDDLFTRSDVVSLHAPLLPQTRHLLRGRHFSLMKEGATFINTARGAIVHEDEMLDVLARRTDLFAVLDVTHPEPPKEGSRVYSLPNVVHTPHIAGSMGRECYRMGQMMVEELDRYLADEPMRWEIDRDKARLMA